VGELQKLVEAWEEIALRHDVEKIKTIGDAFMAACGLLKPVANPVLSCLQFAVKMRGAVRELAPHWDVRIGIHAGEVVAGVLGRRQYLFDLWGDTVNTAARMESHGVEGHITLSPMAWEQVEHCCRGRKLRARKIKGKGLMKLVKFVEFTE
jgi:class 3 adenylate cyclase